MSTQPVLFPVLLAADADPLVRAVAAYLARFRDAIRVHTESDLRAFLTWCVERRLPPLSAQQVHIELYVRWMQEVRRFKPSTVSRRMSVLAGFYRTCDRSGAAGFAGGLCGGRMCRLSRRRWACRTCSSKRCSPPRGTH